LPLLVPNILPSGQLSNTFGLSCSLIVKHRVSKVYKWRRNYIVVYYVNIHVFSYKTQGKESGLNCRLFC
jgi:hypothetical protein